MAPWPTVESYSWVEVEVLSAEDDDLVNNNVSTVGTVFGSKLGAEAGLSPLGLRNRATTIDTALAMITTPEKRASAIHMQEFFYRCFTPFINFISSSALATLDNSRASISACACS